MEGVLYQQTANISACLAAQSLCEFRTCDKSYCKDASRSLASWCEKVLSDASIDDTSREHYKQLLDVQGTGVGALMLLLSRRRWLMAVDAETTWAQWRTQTPVDRLIHGVYPEGKDLFSALRRTLLASQVPELAETPGVVRWMHVVDAMEETDQIYARIAAAEAWRALAPMVTLESLLWALQTAHFLDALPDLCGWFTADGGVDAEQLRTWLKAWAEQLQTTPALGRYGPPDDLRMVKARHVSRLIK